MGFMGTGLHLLRVNTENAPVRYRCLESIVFPQSPALALRRHIERQTASAAGAVAVMRCVFRALQMSETGMGVCRLETTKSAIKMLGMRQSQICPPPPPVAIYCS